MHQCRQNAKNVYSNVVKTAKPHPPGEEHLPTSLFPPLVPHPLLLSGRLLFQPFFSVAHTLPPPPPPPPALLSSLHKGCPIFQGPASKRNKGSEWAWQRGTDGGLESMERKGGQTTDEQVEERTVSALHTSGRPKPVHVPRHHHHPPTPPTSPTHTHTPRRPYVPTQQSLTLTFCDLRRSIFHLCTRSRARALARVIFEPPPGDGSF